MSKKDGAVFSKSLFGYKKRDVNEYIRLSDESNSEKLKGYELRIKELEDAITRDKAAYQTDIKKLSDEKDSAIKDAERAGLEFEKKLAESEARGASYLKLADDATQRAESAEARVKELSSELEIQKAENISLKTKSDVEEKQIIQLSAEVARLSAIEAKERNSKAGFFKLRRPTFFRIVKK